MTKDLLLQNTYLIFRRHLKGDGREVLIDRDKKADVDQADFYLRFWENRIFSLLK